MAGVLIQFCVLAPEKAHFRWFVQDGQGTEGVL